MPPPKLKVEDPEKNLEYTESDPGNDNFIVLFGRNAVRIFRKHKSYFVIVAILLFLYFGHEARDHIPDDVSAFKPSSIISLPRPTIPEGSKALPDPAKIIGQFDRPSGPLKGSEGSKKPGDIAIQKSAPPVTSNFKPFNVSGFANDGVPGLKNCHDITHNTTISYSVDQVLTDNVELVAAGFDDHPLVLKHAPLGKREWQRFLGSSIWLPDQGVYLLVSRIAFLPYGEPMFSTLRGQIYDKDWNEIHKYSLQFQGETIEFPTNFDISFDFELEGRWYGPEDPRVIIEEGVKGAEPVIIFNQYGPPPHWSRAMWAYRPFSKTQTIFTIQGQLTRQSEKNWAPFFYRSAADVEKADQAGFRTPTNHIHFVYGIEPLHVVECHLWTGLCKTVFQQQVPENLKQTHLTKKGQMRGGTQFITVPHLRTAPGTQVYVAVPRTHTEYGCPLSVYRPEITVLGAVNGSFHWLYASEAMELLSIDEPYLKPEKPKVTEEKPKTTEEKPKPAEQKPKDDIKKEAAKTEAAKTEAAKAEGAKDEVAKVETQAAKEKRDVAYFERPGSWNPCDENRILISNSIVSWDVDPNAGKGEDMMTMTFTVQDRTIQLLRLKGMYSLITSIPALQEWLKHDTSSGGLASWNIRWDAVGRDVLQCSVETSHYHAMKLKHITQSNEQKLKDFIASHPDSEEARKQRENEANINTNYEKAKEDEARKKDIADAEHQRKEVEALLQKEKDWRSLRQKELEWLEIGQQHDLTAAEEEEMRKELKGFEELEKELREQDEREGKSLPPW